MLTISKAALLAATLGFSAIPVIGALPALAQDAVEAEAGDTGADEDDVPFAVAISVPSIIAVDSSMDEAALRDVFTTNFLDRTEELANLDATSITIPELSLSLSVTEGEETYDSSVVYRDLVLTNIVDGRVESMTIGSMETVAPDERTVYGGTTQDGFDIRRTLELVGLVEGDASAPMSPLYNSFTIGSGTHESQFFSCSFGELTGTATEARPVGTPFSAVMSAVSELVDAGDEPPAAAIGTVIEYAVDVFTAFRGGAMSMGPLDCAAADESMPISLSLAGTSSGPFEPGIYPEMHIDGLAVDAGELGNGSLDSFVLKPIDLNPTLGALRASATDLDEQWFEANWRSLIPAISGFSLGGLDLDVINPEAEGERVQATIGSLDLDLSAYVNGVPSRVAFSGDGIDVPLPQDSTDPQVTMLLAAGLDKVNMGFNVAAGWDEATESIALTEAAIGALDLGRLSVSADIGNATAALFDSDTDVAAIAAQNVTVRSVTLHFTDEGFGDIAWPLAAAQEGQTDVEAFRTQMAGFAEGLALQLFGSTEQARGLGAALGDFVSGRAASVTLTLTAKDPAGLPLPAFIAAQEDPTVLAGLLDVSGSAQ